MNTISITLTCNGRTLAMGKNSDIDITRVTGLESSELEISSSDNALVDGATVDGKKIKPRPIHIEAAFKDIANNKENRAALIKFFNPKYTGKALIENMGVSRNIEYELEGWEFEKQANLNTRLKVVIDLLCPDPYMLNIDNFGKNMAAISPLFAFPWFSLGSRMTEGKLDYPAEARGLLLGGTVMGYRTLHEQAVLANDGDVPTGVIIKFTATRGSVKNPKITNVGTGEFMRVIVDMEKGDVVTVDTNVRHQIVELNGANYYQHIDRASEPFQLEVGDNYLEYAADENYTNLDVNLYYTPKYLGV
ncbi:MAG: phage tail family protein [Clostridia bacterium]|nr:phage tail family protein [Clostridia bacterium]